MGKWMLFAALVLVPFGALAETITFELYELSKTGTRSLVAKGEKDYSLKDVIVDEHWFGREKHWSKEILVSNGFSAGGSIYREKDLIGFGLWLKKSTGFVALVSGGGFSWDWFNREDGTVYRKLQGPGRVKVTLVPSSEFQEIASIEFLEDVTLRLNADPWFFFTDRDTHNLVIAKGSILRFAP